MFLENKYSKIYYMLIERAKARNLTNQYSEKHHIIPKCIGGDDAPSNIIVLTGREQKIGVSNRGKTTGRIVPEERRLRISKSLEGRTSKRKGRKFPDTHRSHSIESKIKMAESHMNRETKQCEHCSKVVQVAAYGRWHGERCRQALITP